MRLTADLVLRSPAFINALKERELDLRGNKIPLLENLGTTQDQFDTIDLSDNEISRLENFPLLSRLHTILLHNNHVGRIDPNLGESLPSLHTLILTNNRLVNLSDIDPLADIPSLRTLSLMDNTITKRQNYRLYCICKLPHLKVLDFKKIKLKEREDSERLFGKPESAAARKAKAVERAKVFVPGEGLPGVSSSSPSASSIGMSPEQAQAVKAAIEKATSMEEIARLERALQSGHLPADLVFPSSSKTVHPNGTSSEKNDVEMADADS